LRAPAATLSLFTALSGMFYTAIVVSQFVGLAQAAPRVSGTAADGNLLLAQLRMGVYCYLSVLATVGASSHP
jgi:hypothetical protein